MVQNGNLRKNLIKLKGCFSIVVTHIVDQYIPFQGISVTQNVSWGIIISTKSLVLQRVTRLQSGLYACTAINDRGETQSEPVSLRIHCKYIATTDVIIKF